MMAISPGEKNQIGRIRGGRFHFTESQNCSMACVCLTYPLLQQGHPEQGAQAHVLVASEDLQEETPQPLYSAVPRPA